MEIDTQLGSLIHLVQWIDDKTKGLQIDGGERQQIVAACFDVALEHQMAIALLCKENLFGSMLAMLRVISESVVRGLWLLYCASEDDLEKFKTGRIDKHFGDLTAEIETAIGAYQPTLSTMKKNAWSAMNDFTHTGYGQVTRRHGGGKLGANYTDVDVIRCINAAAALGLLASAQLSEMAQQDALVKEHLEKMESFTKTP